MGGWGRGMETSSVARTEQHSFGESWEPGMIVLGDFVVEGHLGRGGFGRVELVRSRRSGELYAVKRVLLADQDAQARFLLEAQRWISFPDHPHVAACRFVRTIGQESAVFAEYVSGGSLADWLHSGRLYDGGDEAPLSRILDVAVQSAWGMHAAHRMGLLHLDLKPANVLVTNDGVAKVTDFGLAATRERSAEETMQVEAVIDYIAGDPELDTARREIIKGVLRQQLYGDRADESLRVQAPGGMTQAYASPEQAEGGVVTRTSDIWSWGVTVLEMFMGERTWPSGTLAAAVLDQIGKPYSPTPRVALPDGVVDVLRQCFQDDPAARPASFDDLARRLVDLHLTLCGFPLGRAQPADVSLRDVMQIHHDRRLSSGGDWDDPRLWLQMAYEAAGEDAAQAVAHWPSGVGTTKARLLEDVRALGQAERVLVRAGAEHADGLAYDLARLRGQIARVRRRLGDADGAIQDYEAASRLLELMPGDEPKILLASVYTDHAILLRGEGRRDEALARCDEAIKLCREVDAHELARLPLGNALLAKANTMADDPQRIVVYDEALVLYREEGDAIPTLRALAAKASAIAAYGREQEAAPLWAEVDSGLEQLPDADRSYLVEFKATILLNRALEAPSLPASLEFAEAAVEIFSDLVRERGRYELAGELGTVAFKAGQAYEHTGRPQEAVQAYGNARDALEQAVVRDGRFDLADELALAFDHEATLIRMLGDPATAVRIGQHAVEMWRRLAEAEDDAAWLRNLGTAHQKLAASLDEAGDGEAALAELDEALRLLQSSGDPSSDEEKTRLAGVHHTRGVALRRVGEPSAAIEAYLTALSLLEENEELQALDQRALSLRSLSNALEDVGEPEQALDAIDSALQLLDRAAEQGAQNGSDLAEAHHNRVNKLMALGDYEGASGEAAATLELYHGLVNQAGRSDLLSEMARLQGAYAFLLERLLDFDEAITALRAASELFESVMSSEPNQLADVLKGLDARRTRLEELRASRPDDVPIWLERAREDIETGSQLSRRGLPDQACMFLEDAVGWMLWLLPRHPSDELYELCGRGGTTLGVVAMYGRKPLVASAAFASASRCLAYLIQDRGRSEQIDTWAGAQLGLATLKLSDGDETAAKNVLQAMKRFVRATAPARLNHWSRNADDLLARL